MTTPDLTDDAFLGGRLRLLQPRSGYRAGIDPVLLAASVPARAGESVLDMGCGVDTALYCLASRVPGLILHGLEVDAATADLARQNAERNGLAAHIHRGDVAARPPDLRSLDFDYVVTNPPYYKAATRTRANDPSREMALSGADMVAWCDACIRRLKPGGRLTLIQDAEALPDLLCALDPRVGGIEVKPLAPREGMPARRVLLTATKGSRATFRLHPPTALHVGTSHEVDANSYVPEISAVLRNGAAFSWSGT